METEYYMLDPIDLDIIEYWGQYGSGMVTYEVTTYPPNIEEVVV